MDYSKFASRKFIVAVLTLVAVMLGIEPESMVPVAAVISVYLGGQSFVDSKSYVDSKTK